MIEYNAVKISKDCNECCHFVPCGDLNAHTCDSTVDYVSIKVTRSYNYRVNILHISKCTENQKTNLLTQAGECLLTYENQRVFEFVMEDCCQALELVNIHSLTVGEAVS